MARSSQVFRLVREAGGFGVSAEGVALDWGKVVDRKDEIGRRLARQQEEELDSLGVALFRAWATFLSPHLISVDGRNLRAGRVLVAVGSRVARPPIPGLELAITSDEALEMRDLPESVVVIGGGVIAMEFAHIWSGAGVQVTVLETGRRILGSSDEELSREVARLSLERGIEIVTAATVERVVRIEGGLEVLVRAPEGIRRLRGDRVMLAAGRVPNTEGVGLECAGVRVDKGKVAVNEYLQSTAPHVYCGGDATGSHYLAPVAAYEGSLAVKNALLGNVERADYQPLPGTVFTDPPLASVGWTEVRAKSSCSSVVVIRVPFSQVARATVEGEPEGILKVVVDNHSGEILGAHILGAQAEELIHEFAIAMKAGMAIQELARVIPVNPSFSEAVMAAALKALPARRAAAA